MDENSVSNQYFFCLLAVVVCCIYFSNTLKLNVVWDNDNACVCCICFSNTLKRSNLE